MRWRRKALIQQVCALVPGGGAVYPELQRRMGGNEYSYCNRLRAPQFEQAFTAAGFHIEHSDRTVDQPSRDALEAGFPLHPDFARFSPADLATTELVIYARPASAAGAPPAGAHGQRGRGGQDGRAGQRHTP